MAEKEKEIKKMATQMQATPVLQGKYAQEVLKEVSRKPTSEQRRQLRDKYRKMFEEVKVKGNK